MTIKHFPKLSKKHSDARRDIVRNVNGTSENSGASIIPKQEQADILRRVAEQLDKADERTGVIASSKQRLDAKYQPASFFTGQDRHLRYWDGRAHSPDCSRAAADMTAREKQANKADEIVRSSADYWDSVTKAKALELRPMRYFDKSQDQDHGPAM